MPTVLGLLAWYPIRAIGCQLLTQTPSCPAPTLKPAKATAITCCSVWTRSAFSLLLSFSHWFTVPHTAAAMIALHLHRSQHAYVVLSECTWKSYKACATAQRLCSGFVDAMLQSNPYVQLDLLYQPCSLFCVCRPHSVPTICAYYLLLCLLSVPTIYFCAYYLCLLSTSVPTICSQRPYCSLFLQFVLCAQHVCGSLPLQKLRYVASLSLLYQCFIQHGLCMIMMIAMIIIVIIARMLFASYTAHGEGCRCRWVLPAICRPTWIAQTATYTRSSSVVRVTMAQHVACASGMQQSNMAEQAPSSARNADQRASLSWHILPAPCWFCCCCASPFMSHCKRMLRKLQRPLSLSELQSCYGYACSQPGIQLRLHHYPFPAPLPIRTLMHPELLSWTLCQQPHNIRTYTKSECNNVCLHDAALAAPFGRDTFVHLLEIHLLPSSATCV